jgi:hypothetical protein
MEFFHLFDRKQCGGVSEGPAGAGQPSWFKIRDLHWPNLSALNTTGGVDIVFAFDHHFETYTPRAKANPQRQCRQLHMFGT